MKLRKLWDQWASHFTPFWWGMDCKPRITLCAWMCSSSQAKLTSNTSLSSSSFLKAKNISEEQTAMQAKRITLWAWIYLSSQAKVTSNTSLSSPSLLKAKNISEERTANRENHFMRLNLLIITSQSDITDVLVIAQISEGRANVILSHSSEDRICRCPFSVWWATAAAA